MTKSGYSGIVGIADTRGVSLPQPRASLHATGSFSPVSGIDDYFLGNDYYRRVAVDYARRVEALVIAEIGAAFREGRDLCNIQVPRSRGTSPARRSC